MSDIPSSARLDVERVKRGGLAEFVKRAWHQVDPAPLIWEPHMDEVCKHLEAVIRGDILRLIINIPPAMSKSVLCNIFAPAYAWIIDPTFRMGYIGNDLSLTRRDARKCRLLIESDWFQERWPLKMMDDANKIEEFTNEKTGVRSSFTIRQQITGHHWNMVTIDDPHKPQSFNVGEGTNEAEYAAKWYDEVLPTRFLEPEKARIIIIMQRLAEHDLAGHVLEKEADEVVHLCLPMEAVEEPKKTPLGGDWRLPYYEEDDPEIEPELLAPIRFPKAVVERLKKSFSSARVASAQLQQDPIPGDGVIFLADYFLARFSKEEIPHYAPIYLSIDCSFKDADTSDYVVGTAWATFDNEYYLLDLMRGRWGFIETGRRIMKWLAKYHNYTGLLIEDKANGTPIIESLIALGVKKIIPFNPGRVSKVERAFACTPLFEDGDVKFPLAEPVWWGQYLHELLGFPAARFDDCVDSTTQALIYMSQLRGPNLPRAFRNLPKLLKETS